MVPLTDWQDKGGMEGKRRKELRVGGLFICFSLPNVSYLGDRPMVKLEWGGGRVVGSWGEGRGEAERQKPWQKSRSLSLDGGGPR